MANPVQGIVQNGKGWITFGEGNLTPPKPLPIFEGTVEHWASLKGTPAWRVAAIKAHRQLAPHGAPITEEDYDLAVEEVGAISISSR